MRTGEIFVPVTSHKPDLLKSKIVVYKNCITPPPKSVLMAMLEAEADAQEINLGMDFNHMPDRIWMIITLATLNPDHEIF